MKFITLTTDITYTKNNCAEGGNAYVFDAVYKGKDGYVVKILKDKKDDTKHIERFKFEIEKVIEKQDLINGIIPIIEYNIEGPQYWYLMPKATPIIRYMEIQEQNLKKNSEFELESIKIKVRAILSISHTLGMLHKEDIHHRDIKPSNLYFYKDNFCLSDFGLVDFPDKIDLTPSSERIGPQGYIPDEMRRDTQNVDFKKVDVYELAKSLWALLTNNIFIFQGKYDEEDELIGITTYFKEKHHLVEIEELLLQSTQNHPSLRPDITTFSEILQRWLETVESLTLINISQWDYIKNKLFPKTFPNTTEYTDIDDILYILTLISRLPGINHMFIPDGGGLDLDKIEKAAEKGCITMNANGSYITLKPKKLLVEYIEKDPVWSYIWLEADALEKIETSNINDEYKYIYERLTEITPGNYGSWLLGNYGKYDNGARLPEGYRIVSRYLSGAFVFFPKSSIYNHTNATYDGRHNNFESSVFRKYIEVMKKVYTLSPYLYDELFNKPILSEEIENAIDESKKNLPTKNEMDNLSTFITDKFCSLNFRDICTKHKEIETCNSIFYISLEKTSITIGKDNPFLKRYINNKFDITQTNMYQNRTPEDAFLFYNYNDAYITIKELKEHLITQCAENSIKWIDEPLVPFRFSIHMHRNTTSKPQHLFTERELYKILKSGDDSKTNVLVVDDNGYCRLVDFDEHLSQYPVVNEAYIARNGYVGHLSDFENAHDEYIDVLYSWLKYLEHGTQQRIGIRTEEVDEGKIREEILQYY